MIFREAGLSEINKEQLFEYGVTHFPEAVCIINERKGKYEIGQFSDIADEKNKELKKIFDVEHASLESIPEEWRVRIQKFILSEKDQEIEKILNRQHVTLLDCKKVLLPHEISKITDENNQLIFAIYRVILKDQSFAPAVLQNQESGVMLGGFENDPDISDISSVLDDIMPKHLMARCLISKIQYRPKVVHIWISGKDFFLSHEQYEAWKIEQSIIHDYKVRAESHAEWNATHNFTPKYVSLPIFVYSFEDENLTALPYLDSVAGTEKMRRYKIGTLTHEIGHSMYSYLLDSKEQEIWKQIIDEVGNLTTYSAKYANGTQGSKVNYMEEFAEAIRLRTTVPDYLRENFLKVFQFLERLLPELGSI